MIICAIAGLPRAPGGQVTEPLGAAADIAPHVVASRWLYPCLLAGLIGGLIFALVVLRPGEDGPPSHLRRTVLTAATGAGVLAALAGLIELVGRSGAAGRAVLLDTSWGRLWLSRELAVIALTVVAGALRDESARWHRARRVGAAIGIAAVVLTAAYGGETLLLEAAYRLALLGWIGGLASLAVVGLATRPAALAAPIRDRAAALGAAGLILVAATGLAAAGREIGPHGWVVLVKAVVLLAVAGLGMAWAGRPRLLGARLAAGVVPLLMAGLLAGTPPHRPAPAAATRGGGPLGHGRGPAGRTDRHDRRRGDRARREQPPPAASTGRRGHPRPRQWCGAVARVPGRPLCRRHPPATARRNGPGGRHRAARGAAA